MSGFSSGSCLQTQTSASLVILDSTITECANNARFGGPAIGLGSSGDFTIRNSLMSSNNGITAQATVGGSWTGYTGAIHVGNSGNNEITNVTFYDNGASYNGAIYVSSGADVTITNSTFIANKGNVSGNDIHAFGSGSTVYLSNTIIADKAGFANGLVAQSGGSIVDGGNNIVETESGSGISNGVNGNLVGDQGSLNIDSGLAVNSATTSVPTIALLVSSVAIDSGTTTSNNGVSVPLYDARGFARDGSPDIGAFEYGAVSPDSVSESGGSNRSRKLVSTYPPSLSVYTKKDSVILNIQYDTYSIATDSLGVEYYKENNKEDKEHVKYEGSFSSVKDVIRNLECNEEYLFVAYSENSTGKTYSETQGITTGECAVEKDNKTKNNDNENSSNHSIKALQSTDFIFVKAPSKTYDFPTRNLYAGLQGDDVKILQEFLIDKNIGSASKYLKDATATGYFGVLTKSALAEFQVNADIYPSSGYYGPITRAYLNL